MFFKTLVESILKQTANPEDHLACSATNALTRDIKNDLIQAYGLSEPLVRKHMRLFRNSNSFLDFLIKFSKLPHHEDFYSNARRNEPALDVCENELEICQRANIEMKSQLRAAENRLRECQKERAEFEDRANEDIKSQKIQKEDELKKYKTKISDLKERNEKLKRDLEACLQRVNDVHLNLNDTINRLRLENVKTESLAQGERNTFNMLCGRMEYENKVLQECMRALPSRESQTATVSEMDPSLALPWRNPGLFTPQSIERVCDEETELDLQTQLKLTGNNLNKCTTELKELKDEIRDLKKEKEDLIDQVSDKDDRLNRSLQAEKDCREKLETVQSELGKVERDNQSSKKRRSSNPQLLKVKKEYSDEVIIEQSELETVRKQLTETQTELETLKTELSNETTQLKNILKEKNTQLQACSLQNTQYLDQMQRKDAELEGLNEQLNEKNVIVERVYEEYSWGKSENCRNVTYFQNNANDILSKLNKDLESLKIFRSQVDRVKREANLINAPAPEEFADALLNLISKMPTYLTEIANVASLPMNEELVGKIKIRLSDLKAIAAAASLPVDDKLVEKDLNATATGTSLPLSLLAEEIIKRLNEYENNDFDYINFAKCFPGLHHTDLKKFVEELPTLLDRLKTTLKKYHANLICDTNHDWISQIIKGVEDENEKKIEQSSEDLILDTESSDAEEIEGVQVYSENIKLDSKACSTKKSPKTKEFSKKQAKERAHYYKGVGTLKSREPRSTNSHISSDLKKYFQVDDLKLYTIRNRIQNKFHTLFKVHDISEDIISKLTFAEHFQLNFDLIQNEWNSLYKQWLHELEIDANTPKEQLLNSLVNKRNAKVEKNKRTAEKSLDSCNKKRNEKTPSESLMEISDTKSSVDIPSEASVECYDETGGKKMKLLENYSVTTMQNWIRALYVELFTLKLKYFKGILPKDEKIKRDCQKKISLLEKIHKKEIPRESILLKVYTEYVQIDMGFYIEKLNYFTETVADKEVLNDCMRITEKYLQELLEDLQKQSNQKQ